MRQWILCAEQEIERFRNGEGFRVFEVLLSILKKIPSLGRVPTLLEVGAAAAFYSEILKIGKFNCEYSALDYSEAFQALAWRLFPAVPFTVGDARALPFPDRSFDILLSGCCLLHIFDFEKAIQEAARVSDGWVVFHRTPLVLQGETRFFQKLAYQTPCIEIHFAYDELAVVFAACGLALVDAEDIFCDFGEDYRHTTLLLRKI